MKISLVFSSYVQALHLKAELQGLDLDILTVKYCFYRRFFGHAKLFILPLRQITVTLKS